MTTDENRTGLETVTEREKVEGSDGIKRTPCDKCGTADAPELLGPEGENRLLCPDCYEERDSK